MNLRQAGILFTTWVVNPNVSTQANHSEFLKGIDKTAMYEIGMAILPRLPKNVMSPN